MKGIKKRRLGSYPGFTVVFSIFTSLFLLGLFGLVIIFANQLADEVKTNLEINVYLQKNISISDRTRLDSILKASPFVSKTHPNAVYYISKEVAGKEFIEATGENYKEFLGENPLRDAYILKMNPDYAEKQQLLVFKKQLEKLPGVFEVEYIESLIESIQKNIARITITMVSFAVLLFVAIILLIRNTIKISLYSQRLLIRSMQLVGATDWFIKKPFVFRALRQGFGGAVLSCLALSIVVFYLNKFIPELNASQSKDKILILFGSMIFSGTILGMVSAWLSTSKYLKMTLDELY